jgi:hypothetical protein
MRITTWVLGPQLSLEAARALPANFTSFENFPEKNFKYYSGLKIPGRMRPSISF